MNISNLLTDTARKFVVLLKKNWLAKTTLLISMVSLITTVYFNFYYEGELEVNSNVKPLYENYQLTIDDSHEIIYGTQLTFRENEMQYHDGCNLLFFIRNKDDTDMLITKLIIKSNSVDLVKKPDLIVGAGMKGGNLIVSGFNNGWGSAHDVSFKLKDSKGLLKQYFSSDQLVFNFSEIESGNEFKVFELSNKNFSTIPKLKEESIMYVEYSNLENGKKIEEINNVQIGSSGFVEYGTGSGLGTFYETVILPVESGFFNIEIPALHNIEAKNADSLNIRVLPNRSCILEFDVQFEVNGSEIIDVGTYVLEFDVPTYYDQMNFSRRATEREIEEYSDILTSFPFSNTGKFVSLEEFDELKDRIYKFNTN